MVMRKDGVLIVKLVDLELAESMADEHELCDYIVSVALITDVCLTEKLCSGHTWLHS